MAKHRPPRVQPKKRRATSQDMARLAADADRLRRQGRADLAEARYRELLEMDRHHHLALRGLAQLAYERMDLDEAIRTLRLALSRHPMRAELHGDLARTLQVRGLHTEAMEAYARSVGIDKTYVPSWCGIGEIHERLGAFDEARRAFEQALSIDPERDATRFYLARVLDRAERRDEAMAMLTELAERSSGELEAKCREQIGRSHDRAGRHLEGFDEVARAKAIRLALIGDLEAVGALSHRQRTDEAAQMAKATPDLLARWASSPVEQDRDVAFLVGFPRSGTTLTERVLDAHPDVLTTDETMVVSELEGHIKAFPVPGELAIDKLAAAPTRIVGDLQAWYFNRVEEILGRSIGSRLLVDKMPLNILRVPLLARVFPKARVILALRDPRDVVISCFMRLGEGGDAQTLDFLSIEGCVDRYCRVMGAWLEFADRCPLPVITMRYEQTVADLPGEARRLLEFLGMPWDDRVLAFHAGSSERYVKSPTYDEVGQAVHTRSVERWRRYEARLPRAQLDRLRPFIEAFGYRP